MDWLKSEKEFENEQRNIKIAVMGCVVNGPGEAREADEDASRRKGEGVYLKRGAEECRCLCVNISNT